MKRESLPGKLQENTELPSNSLKISQKYQSIEVIQLYETQEKMLKCYWYLAISSSYTICEDTFAVFPFTVYMFNSPV